MRTWRVVVAAIVGLVGLVWIGQGVGLIGGGAMSGSGFWAVVGLVLLVVAGGLLLYERRRSTTA